MDRVLDLGRLNDAPKVTQFRTEPRFKSRLIYHQSPFPCLTLVCLQKFPGGGQGVLGSAVRLRSVTRSQHILSEARNSAEAPNHNLIPNQARARGERGAPSCTLMHTSTLGGRVGP